MASPLAVVTVLVGAEEAPTESYVAMVSERWIRSSQNEHTIREHPIPLLAVGDRVDVESVLKWQEQFADDFRALDESTAANIAVRLMMDLGVEYPKTVVSKVATSGPDEDDKNTQ